MAIDDFVAKEKPSFKVEMVSADHQNKGDIAANKAREWFEREKVDVATELVTTSVALAVQKIAKEKNRIALISGAASTRRHQRGLQRRHGALDLRHLCGGQRHGQGGDQDRWQEVVLPDGRLRLRPLRWRRTPARGQGQRRRGAGSVRHPFPGTGLLVLPAQGPELWRADHRPGQRRRRHHQLDQAGGRVWRDPQAVAGRAC
jgi:hypothetical protein